MAEHAVLKHWIFYLNISILNLYRKKEREREGNIMNITQKIATIVFLILFWITCFNVPWRSKILFNGREVVSYKVGNILQAPKNMDPHPNISFNIVFIWTALFINYGMILALCTDTKKEELTGQRKEKTGDV